MSVGLHNMCTMLNFLPIDSKVIPCIIEWKLYMLM